MLDGLIFDVDGTLWDSTDLVAKAWNYVLETETNLPADVTGDLLKPFSENPWMRSVLRSSRESR